MHHFLQNKKTFLFLGILFLVCFYLFSRQVKKGFMKSADFAATVKIQERIDKSSHLRAAEIVDNTMEGSTFLASPGVSVMLVLFLTAFAVVDLKNKRIHLRGLAIPVLFGLLVLGEVYGKSVVHHPSPPFQFIKHPVSFFPTDYINEQFSYPSGHAARAVYISVVIGSLFIVHSTGIKRKSIKLFGLLCLICYVGMVSVSRIYLGHHWLSDIIGGFFLGSGCSFIAGYLTIDDTAGYPYNKQQ
jgi:membrane-associated phospholipid phosphatase